MRTIQDAIKASDEQIRGVRRAQGLAVSLEKMGWPGSWFVHPDSVNLQPDDSADLLQIIDYLESSGWVYNGWIRYDRTGYYGIFWKDPAGLSFGLTNLRTVPAGYDGEEEEI